MVYNALETSAGAMAKIGVQGQISLSGQVN